MIVDVEIPGLEKEHYWLMTISAFFDESGKFKDKKVVSIGGVASFQKEFDGFSWEWRRLLRLNGMTYFTAKQVLKPHVPLSKRNSSTGLEKRIDDLLPFVACIRKNLQVISSVAIDVEAYKKLPSHFIQFFGGDPVLPAFLRSILQVIEFTERDPISFVFDEDEETTISFYRLYKQVKREWPKAKQKCAAISFADDRQFLALQAADFVASIVRKQIDLELNKTAYDYTALHDALAKEPEHNEKLWFSGVGLGDRKNLQNMAQGLKKEWERLKREKAQH